MKQFCKECGKEAQPDHNICVHCGAPLGKNETQDEAAETKNDARASGVAGGSSNTEPTRSKRSSTPMPKKKKRFISMIVIAAVILIGFTMWAQSYQSPQSVQKRFYNAAVKDDSKALQKLLIHEDGSKATEGEALALIKLVKENGDYVLNDYFSIEPEGKFLLFFQAHKAQAIDQFAYYPDPVKGLTFTFNGIEPSVRDKVLYGPLIPGIYDVEAAFEGDYGETTIDGDITLGNYYSDEVLIEMDINIADVMFYIANAYEIDHENVQLKIKKEEIPIDDEGYSEAVGPFVLDGSQQVQTVVSMPWGKIESDPIDIMEHDMTIYADVLSDENYEEITELLGGFGEQFVEAFAEKDADLFENVSGTVKDSLTDMMDRRFYDDDWFYTGEFIQLEVDKDSIYLDFEGEAPALAIVVQYIFNEGYHELNEEPELMDEALPVEAKLQYNSDEKTWTIANMTDEYWGTFEDVDEIAGSQTVFGPSEKAVKAAKDSDFKNEMTVFIEDYTRASVDAINYTDFSYVEGYIAEDGPRWEEARDYIDYLDSKNITEDFLDMEVESIESIEDDSWEVTVKESFTIYKDDSSDDKDFRTKVIVKKIDDEFLVYELIETNEI